MDAALPAAVLLSALKTFAGLAPQTRVHLTEVVLSGADQALLQQQADLAVGTRIPTGHFGERLLDIPFVAVAHPAHPLHQLGRTLTAEDLSREMQVVLRDSGKANPRDDGWLGATLRWTVSHMDAMRMLVAGGLGFAWLPEHLVADAARAGALLPLPLREGRIRHVPLSSSIAGPTSRALPRATLPRSWPGPPAHISPITPSAALRPTSADPIGLRGFSDQWVQNLALPFGNHE